MFKTTMAILFCCLAVSCKTLPRANKPVTVWYEATYVTTEDGGSVQKVETIPWTDGLTALRAIASAGGYVTPPTSHVYLVRNGSSTELNTSEIEKQAEPDIRLKPGDRIELRR